MFAKWFPWRWLVRALARAHGLLDPLEILARLENLAQPSEVAAPIELLRAGFALHARGVINDKVIQQNLDWVWPFWVNRQFDPRDPAFVPRAFSFAQVNLSHRNWTAVGVPGCEAMAVVDPRGLVMPFWDGWSLDAWAVPLRGEALWPSRLDRCEQRLRMDGDRLAVETIARNDLATLRSLVWVEPDAAEAFCRIRYEAVMAVSGWLVIALRPFNPEGVGFVQSVALGADRKGWILDDRLRVRFDAPVERHVCSCYGAGDVAIGLLDRSPQADCRCKVGLATAAAMFPVEAGQEAEVTATVPLSADRTVKTLYPRGGPLEWSGVLQDAATMQVPDERLAFLYDAALRTVALLSPAEVYPGPYTYKRFWFRDAVLILHAMLCANLVDHARYAMGGFLRRQRPSGYFHSQSGEWDSNGQVLWLLGRYADLTGRTLSGRWIHALDRAARWIGRKLTDRRGGDPHAGLLPAGFSAEHLGTNDYYYWDDFWSVAGLDAAADLLVSHGRQRSAGACGDLAVALRDSIERSLRRSGPLRAVEGIPASPYRRMDSGAVGSLVCAYPLRVRPADDPPVRATLEFLLKFCMIDGLLFLDTSHSGRNAYLTLSIAQVLLRAGDSRFFPLVQAVAEAASPTGQWPEAIHPHTGGGCMGDGQHAWAAAEWIMMMRNMFVREESDRLILASGIPDAWLARRRAMAFGPTPTPYGPLTVRLEFQEDGTATVRWEARWRKAPPAIEIRLAGRAVTVADPQATSAAVPVAAEDERA
ncbi:MAG: hypothetical protein GX591_01565 [Planctomycetes bacterium]|nr:hypothetical protein [Planctomycetota bacterium]